jgi:hypothetical protein
VRAYQRGWLRADLIAGIPLAACLLPAGIGDASLASLPPEAGSSPNSPVSSFLGAESGILLRKELREIVREAHLTVWCCYETGWGITLAGNSN